MRALTAPPPARRACETRSPASLALVMGAHLALAWMLFSPPPAPPAITAPKPIMVSLITPEAAPAPAKPRPPQPAAALRLQPKPPLLATPREAPAPQASPAATPAASANPAAPAAPLTPPRFDAAYLDNPAPPYPGMARRLGEEGRVLLRVQVAPDGSAAQVELRQSSGHARLDATALETVRRWRFVPARQGDDAVAAWVLVPISFSLRS